MPVHLSFLSRTHIGTAEAENYRVRTIFAKSGMGSIKGQSTRIAVAFFRASEFGAGVADRIVKTRPRGRRGVEMLEIE
jgi:hypothetical protein